MNHALLASELATYVSPDVVTALQLVEQLRVNEATLLPDMAVAAHVFVENEGWKDFGFANARDFSRERLDRSGRWLRNLATLASSFGRLPALRDAISGLDGGLPLGSAAAYEIARVATPGDLQHWIDLARAVPVRELKQELQRSAEHAGGAKGRLSQSADQVSDRRAAVDLAVPRYVAQATGGLEEVYRASNVAATQAEFIDGLIAEYRTSLPTEADPAVCDVPRRLRAPEDRVDIMGALVGSAIRTPVEHRFGHLKETDSGSSHKAIQLARWTLHRTKSLAASMVLMEADAAGTSLVAFEQLGSLLELEREVKLRIAQLMLFVEKRGAWPVLGYQHAVEYGVACLQQSASTTRAWLRIVRAMEVSPELNKACESGLTHQRALRLIALINESKPGEPDESRESTEPAVRAWIDHARLITIKRLDDELRALGAGASRRKLPPPASDQAWFQSVRLAAGDARALLAKQSGVALRSFPVADVFLRLNLPVDIAMELQACIRQAQEHLQKLSLGAAAMSPADEVRQRPSVRLARKYFEDRHCEGPGCAGLNHSCPTRLPSWLGFLAILEEFAEQWDNPQLIQKRPTDHINTRDGWRCTAPGCTARSLEVHHIVYQSHGGSDAPDNLTSLCPFHHRMGEHGVLSAVTGNAPSQLHWRLGTGDAISYFLNERSVQAETSPHYQ